MSNNQLAEDGSDCVTPVIIPALVPILDESLKEDKILCHVRVLCYYFDRSSETARNWSLSASEKVSMMTLFHQLSLLGLRRLVLCYQLSNEAALNLHQVQAHDVRAFAASKAFQGGVPLDQILSTSRWKSQNTYLSFN